MVQLLYNPDGTQKWYQNCKLHRDGGPDVVQSNKTQRWYQNGKLCRDN
jgi:hypothetical protein